MGSIDFARLLNYFLAMVLSLTFHEAAHAWVASLRGDDTAKMEGRLTLNPFAHIDLLGTVILPLIGAITKLPVIGWAKPVPVNTRNLKHPKWDHVLVAAAGPLSNLVLSIASLCFVFAYGQWGTALVPEGSFVYPLIELAQAMVWVNIFLAIFNLIPLPPLDGATVFGSLLPYDWEQKYHEYIAPYGMFLLIAIIASGGLRWLPGLAQGIIDVVLVGLHAIVRT